jgi:hypothetical protein
MQRKDYKVCLVLLFLLMTIPYLYFNDVNTLIRRSLTLVTFGFSAYYLYLFIESQRDKRKLKDSFKGLKICKVYEEKPFYCRRTKIDYYKFKKMNLYPLTEKEDDCLKLESNDIRYLYQKGYVSINHKEKKYTIQLIIS